MARESSVSEPPALREVAAAWHDQMHGEHVSAETRAACARWLAEAPEHRRAYQEIERTWSNLESAAHDPHVLALRHETALRLSRARSNCTRVLKRSVAAAVAIVVGASVLMLNASALGERSLLAMLVDVFRAQSDGRYVTATGERLNVTLSDGSQLTLNTQTEVAVAFTGSERIVRLRRGQAIFEVAKDPKRPFVVEAQQRRLIAVGTAFDVRLDGERIDVTMIEGTVRVEVAREAIARAVQSPPSSANRAAGQTAAVTTIVAGEQLTVDDERLDRVRPTDPERVTSWRRGQVIFEDTRLADAVAELNRYSQTKIELADPRLAELRLSGSFATGRLNVFVEAITTYFQIQVDRADEHTIVLRAREPRPGSVF